jgi:hypothetical protein
VSRRASLSARLGRLEADRPGAWSLTLVDGRRVRVRLADVLAAFAESLAIVHAENGQAAPAPSPTVELLARVAPDSDRSVLGAATLAAARAACRGDA